MLPPITQALIIANVLGFLLEMNMGGLLLQWFALWPGSGSIFGIIPWSAPWQLITYSFLHAGLTHLAFNMFALWMFGADLERVWGGKRLAIAYFASVLTGALAQLLVGALFGPQNGPVIGASAGVFGLLLAYAMVFPNRTIMPLFPPIPMSTKWFALLYGGLELLLGVTGSQAGVAHFAHLGGMLGGFLALQYFRGRAPFGRR